MNAYAFDRPDAAIDALAEPLHPVVTEATCHDFLGRVLAQPVFADRDHPAADVSAMDGYALADRTASGISELNSDSELPVTAESIPGSPPPNFSSHGVIRIFTGGVVPAGCERVIQREYTVENAATPASPLGSIRFRNEARSSPPGANIRRRGENLTVGSQALPAGIVVRSPQAAAIASFGITSIPVHRLVKIAIITTGDELTTDVSEQNLPPWKIRNSNSVAIAALMKSQAYIDDLTLLHAADQPDELQATITTALAAHDVVLLTGGVSMGDHDYVPRIVTAIGAKTIFHKLPLRPGKPILGAMMVDEATGIAKPIIGLPGNPVSATMGAVRFALPVINKLAGLTAWRPAPTSVMLDDVSDKTLPLHWMRAVCLTAPGRAKLLIGKGSGDLVSLAGSDGFIEMPPHANSPGPWPFFAW
jgi:molybdenum cofactor synthesis domain-containing protein